MSIADWLGRTLFLIVSGLATFALIQAIASLSATTPVGAGEGATGNSVSMPVPSAPDAPLLTDGRAGDEDAAPTPPSPGERPVAMSGAARDGAIERIARLLETLTYAVLALTGFVAAGVLVLLRLTAGRG
ncbi:hypothetical protein GO308_12115 [Sphingomonas sp. SFZ2018-12]|uniref:hypothetical protein n=1 Tax=Sphingomonas sp. SFZ2018-12 TaxID=2683197 RepID=UPI001F0E2C21|nr:hypothetical protein [Sphingomonas sp. SFZ2018-12]MCH4893859.1 hypothetical protein [Sphingomonas sp. SFZ2018-12]